MLEDANSRPEVPRRGRADEADPTLIADLLSECSIETVPISSREIASLGESLPPGTNVYVVTPSGRSLADTADTARRLHELGFNPVPHIPARNVADREALEDLLRYLKSRVHIDQVLVIGGSRAKPVGAYHSSLQLFETGLFEKFGIRRIGVAGHPEGHPVVPQDEIIDALRGKLAWAREAGIDMYVVTQFCFDADRVAAWEAGIRASVGAVPVHVGIPGPASLASLIKYARICGVGESVRFLTRGASSLHRLPRWSPDGFLAALAGHRAADADCGIAKVHFYSFGGAAKTARWLASLQAPRSDGRATVAAVLGLGRRRR